MALSGESDRVPPSENVGKRLVVECNSTATSYIVSLPWQRFQRPAAPTHEHFCDESHFRDQKTQLSYHTAPNVLLIACRMAESFPLCKLRVDFYLDSKLRSTTLLLVLRNYNPQWL